jgi:catalase
VASHPESARAAKIIQSHQVSSGFDNSTFNGLNAFRFINTADVSTPVRWSMVPVDAVKPEDTAQSANPDKNYLFDDFIARIHSAPVQWRLILTVGQPGDPTDDATIPWPEDREHVDAGTLTLDEVESEAPGNCRDINFDPLVLPVGIAPSDDPLLSARSAVYSQSFTRRAGEKKEPSAITPSDVRK